MKSEAQTNVVFWHYNQLSIPSFRRSATESGDADEISKLKLENARLQHLVAELLIANQHLRRQYSDSAANAEQRESSAPSNLHRQDS
jgi:hypothetical protein